MKHWKAFKNDRWYLVKYLAAQLAISLLVVGGLWHFIDQASLLAFKPQWWMVALLPLGLIIGVKAPVLIHNCVHGNMKPKWLNQVAGELAGVYVLLSMAAFELNHVMHHAHADTHLDPHNPHQRSFLPFFFANNFGGTDVVLHEYLRFHGDTRASRARFGVVCVLHFLNVPVRMLFWVLLLGPTLFVVAFVPSYLFHMFVFAHINYVTHETRADGAVVLHNLDHNPYYWFVNHFGSGVYFHKNHHRNPNVYNPKLGAAMSGWVR